MINRREWIESVIAATAAALVDTSGLPVPAEQDDEESSISLASCGGGEGWAAKRRFAEYYHMPIDLQDKMTAKYWWEWYRLIPASCGFDPYQTH